MAISFVGSANGIARSGGDVTMTLPTSLEDDLVIVAYTIGVPPAGSDTDFDMQVTTPTGYTEIADLFADDSHNCQLGVFYKKMGATPDTGVTVDGHGDVKSAVAAVLMVFRGVDTATPLDVTSTTATGINTMHPDPPSIDHTNPAGLWTVIAGGSAHLAGESQAYTFPTGYTTNAIYIGERDTTDPFSDAHAGMGYNTSPSDPEDPGTMTLGGTDSTSYSWCAATMALRPASGALPGQVSDYRYPLRGAF